MGNKRADIEVEQTRQEFSQIKFLLKTEIKKLTKLQMTSNHMRPLKMSTVFLGLQKYLQVVNELQLEAN